MSALSRGLSFVGFALLVGCNGRVETESGTPTPATELTNGNDDQIYPDLPPHKEVTEDKDGGQTNVTPTLSPTLQPSECASLVTTKGADYIARIDLAAKKFTLGPKLAMPDGTVLVTETEALGVIGTDLWFCSGIYGQKVARAPLATGVVEKFDVPCRYVTADDTGIYVQHNTNNSISHYADASAVASGMPTSTRPGGDTGALGMSAAGMIWEAYPGGGIRMPSGDVLPLIGQSGSIWALGEASGNRLIVGDKNGVVQAFNATTGSLIEEVTRYPAAQSEYAFWGMACAR